MKQFNFIFILLLFIGVASKLVAQDEVYYRNLLRGKAGGQTTKEKNFKFITKANSYHVDITGDGTQEIITPIKKDGSDWLEISDSSSRKIFESKLQAYGLGAYLYKLQLVQMSKDVKVLLLFYLEGVHNYLELHRSARVYFVTYEKGRFSYNAYPAAHISIEKKMMRNQYWRRLMQVDVVDFNKDRTKEIIISYLTSQHVFQYIGAGTWKRY